MLKVGAIYALLTVCMLSAYAQPYTLKGKVSSVDGEALPGAIIRLHEINLSASTDGNGMFVLEYIKPGSYHIHVNFLGYEEKTIDLDVNGDQYLEISLKEAYKELDEVLVESSFMNSEASESSQIHQNINKEALVRSSGGSFVNALEQIPGITSINTGIGVSKPVIRGMSFNRVVVNDNGIKQEGQQWGSDHGLEIDQFNVGRVEIVKGPASLMYGSDALGGAVNILPAAIPSQGQIGAEVRGLYRSINNTIGTSAMIEAGGREFYGRARFSQIEFGDYRVPASSFSYNSYQLEIENERLKNTAGRERNGAFTLGLRKKWGSASLTYTRFDQRAGLFPGAIGIPRAYDLRDDGNSRNIDIPRQETVHEKVIFNSFIRAGKHWLETEAGYQSNLRSERTIPHAHGVGPVPEGNLALRLNLQTFTFNTRLRRKVNENVRDIYGISGQFQQNAESGFEHLLSPYQSVQAGVYSMRQVKFSPSLTGSGGLRFDYGRISIQEFRAPVWINAESIDYFSQRNPAIDREFYNYSASAGLSWFPDPVLNMKLNLGKSFRIPTAAELSINGVHHGTFRHELGNAELESESGYQLDMAAIFNNRKFSVSFSPYLNYFRNYIYLTPTANFGYFDQTGELVLLPEAGQTFQYRQNNAMISGFEFMADYHLVKEWHIEAGAEYVYKYNLETELPLPFTPPASIQLGSDYDWEFKSFNLGIGAQWKKFFDQNNVDRNERVTPGYDLLNLSMRLNGKWGKQEYALYFSARNVLDEQYLNHLSRYRLLNLPEPGRDFVINLILNFSNK